MEEEWILRDSRPSEKVLHPTTLLAIELIQELKTKDLTICRMLDVGCGSGMLSFIAATLWPQAIITATDISETAINEIQSNIENNGFSGRITALRADGYNLAMMDEAGGYDLVIANLLAELHIKHTLDAYKCIKNNNFIVLSGILSWLQHSVEYAYINNGFKKINYKSNGQWAAYIFQKE